MHEVDLSVARLRHVIWCKTCILFSKIVYSIICIRGDVFVAIFNCLQTLSTFVCKNLLHGIPPEGGIDSVNQIEGLSLVVDKLLSL